MFVYLLPFFISYCTGPGQVRFAHTDMQVPDFSSYRKDSTNNPSQTAEATATNRKSFSYLFAGGGAIIAAYGAKVLVQEFVGSMNASADVLALAKIEVNLNEIPEVREGLSI